MQKLETLITQYQNLETAIQTRQAMLEEKAQQIQAITSVFPPRLLKQLEIELPESLQSRGRQRIDREMAQRIRVSMSHHADIMMTFTRPELLDAVQEAYPGVSTNILNRLFDEHCFRRVGKRKGERGNPVIYSALNGDSE